MTVVTATEQPLWLPSGRCTEVATEPAYANRWNGDNLVSTTDKAKVQRYEVGASPTISNTFTTVVKQGQTMKEYEVAIKITDNDYIDTLVISLVRQGYEVYYNKDEDVVCFKTYDEEVKEINRNGKNQKNCRKGEV